MPHEIEAKYRLDTFARVRRRLREAGGVYLGTVLQTDLYHDTPARRLLKSDCGVRIRHTRCLHRPPGGAGRPDTRALLTWKGPARPHRRAKIRNEVQTRLDDAAAVSAVFEAVGLKPTLTLQKRRASYRLGRCLVELDELPVLGRFVEIESSRPEHIESARGKLGLSETPPITDHYVRMAMRACKRLGGNCRELTFSNCAACGWNRSA